MRRIALILAVLAVVAAAASPARATVVAASSGPLCHVDRAADGLLEADRLRACTPGAYRALGRRAVCESKDRPALRAADRREILDDYGVPGWTGRDGELDHLVPLFLGGRTAPANIWPERGAIPNVKDRLEGYVRHRICVAHTMRPRTGRRIFAADWRVYFRRYRRRGLL